MIEGRGLSGNFNGLRLLAGVWLPIRGLFKICVYLRLRVERESR